MMPSSHAVAGAAVALALAPWLRQRSAALWAGSVLIDVDHYVWYVAQRHDLSLRRAYAYFVAAKLGAVDRGGDARPLHGPINVGWMALLAWRWPAFRPVFLGVLLHSLLDAYGERRLDGILPLALRSV
jgi:membrane-bound metal-dependent hydrolase YbcI (DUF457 family)